MNFEWSDEQQLAYAQVLEFAQTLDVSDLTTRDRESHFNRSNWNRCAEFGLLSMSVPADWHGHGVTEFLTALRSMEAMGYGCPDLGLSFALNAQMWTVQLPIVKFGNAKQKEKYLPGLCTGDLIGAHVITEPESGSDAFSLSTTAKKVDGGYVLNGSKRYISLGPIADVALVFASTNPADGKWGLTGFLVDATSDGFSKSETREKMGLRTVPLGDYEFTNCFVPEANRLGPEGAGVSLATSSLEWERCCILASQLGAMQRQLEASISHAKHRKQFGQSIGKFQAVAHRIVDMKLRLETSRLLLQKVAWLKQNGQSAMTEAALLKLHLAECFTESSLDAIRIHGGEGYMSEAGIERDLRDAVGGLIYAGTSDIQKNIAAQLLGL